MSAEQGESHGDQGTDSCCNYQSINDNFFYGGCSHFSIPILFPR